MSPFPLLVGEVESQDATFASLRQQIEQLRRENTRLDEALRLERIKTGQLEYGVKEIRTMLSPLYKTLRLLFGEFDAVGLTSTNESAGEDFWEKWKKKLGGKQAEIIDALMGHPGMTTTAISKAAGCRLTTASTLLSKMKTMNLLDKQGDKWVLKQV